MGPLPITKLTDEEEAFRGLAAKVAKEKIAPLVKKMDDEKKMDPTVIKTLFESGVCQFDFKLCNWFFYLEIVYGS